MTTRRNMLFLIGGGVVVAAAAGAGAFALASAPSSAARAPWRQAGQYEEYRRRALSYALLAPNPHNRQPWLVRLDGEDALTLYCDLDRRLPVTDPYDRQITIGCGAFLEILALAAAADGYSATITPFPDGDDMATLDARPVAHVAFTPARAATDPLFLQVPHRRSTKEVYEARDVPAELLARLQAAGATQGGASVATADPALVERLRDLTWRAHEREMTTPPALQESVDLMRIGAAEVRANPDGIELEGPLFTAGALAGVVNRRTMADPASQAFRQGLDLYRSLAVSARAFGWIANANSTRADQIAAGRAYVRMNLTATELGLAVHPWSQALQEYPEMSDLYDEAHDLLAGGARLQMLYRIGYARPPGPTPRRGLEAHLV